MRGVTRTEGDADIAVAMRERLATRSRTALAVPVTVPTFMTVAALADIAPNTAKAVDVAGRSILLCNFEGNIFALENRCSHAEEPLACGRIRNGWIACPAHGARFDLETGEAIGPPATDPVATFAVRIDGQAIAIAL